MLLTREASTIARVASKNTKDPLMHEISSDGAIFKNMLYLLFMKRCQYSGFVSIKYLLFFKFKN